MSMYRRTRSRPTFTEWKFDNEADARAFRHQMDRKTRYTQDRLGEIVATTAPDPVAVSVGQEEMGLVMQRHDRRVG